MQHSRSQFVMKVDLSQWCCARDLQYPSPYCWSKLFTLPAQCEGVGRPVGFAVGLLVGAHVIPAFVGVRVVGEADGSCVGMPVGE